MGDPVSKGKLSATSKSGEPAVVKQTEREFVRQVLDES